MKRLLFLLLSICSLGIMAQTQQANSIKLTTTEGTVIYMLYEKPSLRMQDGNFVFRVSYAEITYPAESIKKFEFINVPVEKFIPGDADGNQQVTLGDITYMVQSLNSPEALPFAEHVRFDLNKNGRDDADDIRIAARILTTKK